MVACRSPRIFMPGPTRSEYTTLQTFDDFILGSDVIVRIPTAILGGSRNTYLCADMFVLDSASGDGDGWEIHKSLWEI